MRRVTLEERWNGVPLVFDAPSLDTGKLSHVVLDDSAGVMLYLSSVAEWVPAGGARSAMPPVRHDVMCHALRVFRAFRLAHLRERSVRPLGHTDEDV